MCLFKVEARCPKTFRVRESTQYGFSHVAMLPCCRLTKPFDDTCWVGVRHDTETFSATCVKVERIVEAGGCLVVVTQTALQQLRAGCRCAHEAAPKYLYSHCPESSLEWLVHVTSSSSSSTATVQKAAWNGWYMWPAQALPLQLLFRKQPGTVGAHGQLKLFLNVHYTELYRKSLQHSGARNWNLLPDYIPRQSQTNKELYYYSTCSTFLPIYFVLCLYNFYTSRCNL